MNIESELKKNGIEVTEKLNQEIINNIAKSVSQKFYNNFPNYGLNKEEIYNKIITLNMYKAQMQERNE